MFTLFFSLYASLFRGSWIGIINLRDLAPVLQSLFAEIGKFITSIFGDVQMEDFGTILFDTNLSFGPNYVSMPNYMIVIAFVLALITSIGIVVTAVKGVKKAFGIFFGQIR